MTYNSSVLVLMWWSVACCLRFKKDVLILKCCFRFFDFGFEAIATSSNPSCCLASIVDKTHHGSVIAPFLCTFRSFFSYDRGVLVTNVLYCYWLIYFSYSANTRGAFVIILLICSDLLNCHRSVCTIVITTEIG